ncbi:MAG: HAD family phosphatase [Microlunatus sp.]|nr:HAD family phosphatase [Microlunatus sp.]MDN5771390.1 HAD family phosphatase [Microlunatus sp.]
MNALSPAPSDPDPALQAVLWDFDGTLADTEPLWIAAEFELIEGELGHPWSMEHAEQLVGRDLIDSATYMLNTIGRSDLEPSWVVQRLLGRVVEGVRTAEALPWRPGALDLLAELKEVGVPCALVSASYRVLLDAVLERLPADSFAVSVGGDEVTKGKPHPEPYERACRLLGVDAGSCIVLEDSAPGASAGNAAGAVVIAVPNVVDIPAAPRRVMFDSLTELDPRRLDAVLAEVSSARVSGARVSGAG